MKKTSVRLGAALLCLLMCLSFAGCTVSLDKAQEVMLAKKAYDAILTVNSFSFDLTAQAKGAYGDEHMEIPLTAKGSCIVDPLTAKAELEANIGEIGTLKAPVCLVSTDGQPKLYVGLGIGGATVWVSPKPGESEGERSNVLKDMVKYLMNDPDLISRGEEKKINGAMATPLTIRIPGELLELRDAEGKAIEGAQTAEEQKLTVWLDNESYLPVRLEADIEPAVAYYLSVSEKTAQLPITVESLSVTVDFSEVNAVNTIELPAGLPVSAAVVSPSPRATAELSPEPSPETSTAPSPEPSPEASAEPSPRA